MTKVSLSAITVRTSEYQFAHGKLPRGRGSGRWAFWMGRDTSDIDKALWFPGTYAEAVKQAKRMAQELGYMTVTVGS